MIEEPGLIHRTQITELVATYRESIGMIEDGIALLRFAQEKLQRAFGQEHYGFRVSGSHNDTLHLDQPHVVVARMKRDAWKVLVDRMELRRIGSSKRVAELEKQMETSANLPDITEESILEFMDGALQSIPQMMDEALQEVFETLRPPRSVYKTNSKFEIGKKVILGWAVQASFKGGYQVRYGSEQRIRSIDNVFHMLDGKGVVKTNRGPLVDAICATDSEGIGETDYFKFKCFGNMNLHLEFKRIDLVNELNRRCSGLTLKPENQ